MLTVEAGLILAALWPMAAAILAPLVQRLLGRYSAWLLALVPTAIFIYFLSLVGSVAENGALAARIAWIPSMGLDLAFRLDGLSLAFALAISGIGAMIVLYSGAYLQGHPHLGRFLGFILAFMGAMLGLVLADTMLVLLAFWELTSVASFLLIGFDHARQAARRGAIQALVVTNIGGLALLIAVILMQRVGGSATVSGLAPLGADPIYPVIFICICLAAFTKSAQFPLHFWLPNAMEAPTPVSAFLHSATMVMGGVYLLARLNPVLGGTEAWTLTLTIFGGVTLIWGAFWACRQTDLKQMLAQTTIASLGLLVMLIGIGSEAAITGMIVYFLAHALYKAGLFLVVGAIDHETGTRDLNGLAGLSEHMPLTFIAAAIAGLSMLGVPATLGFFAKEEMYLAFEGGDWSQLLAFGTLVIGNALLGGIGLTVGLRPFLGAERATPRAPHEAPVAMLVGPLLLAAGGIALALNIEWLAEVLIGPATNAVGPFAVALHLSPLPDFTDPLFFASVLTWVLGVVVFMRLDLLRRAMRRIESGFGWTFDKGFDTLMFGLIRFSGAVTRFLHHGRLELYLVLVFSALALALLGPVLSLDGLAALWPAADLGGWSSAIGGVALRPYEWAVVALAVVGLVAVVIAPSRLAAVLLLGIQGTALALLFLLFGAPDLAFTQFMVEILSVVILALVVARLPLDHHDHRPFEDWARDGTIAIVCGAGVSLLLLVVLSGTLDPRLGDFFIETSVPVAHGANIVNVILVDYRGFDTLGEISVVLAAGIAIVTLFRGRAKPAGASSA